MYKFSNRDINNFILLLRRGFFYLHSHLNMGDITDAAYVHAKREGKDF